MTGVIAGLAVSLGAVLIMISVLSPRRTVRSGISGAGTPAAGAGTAATGASTPAAGRPGARRASARGVLMCVAAAVAAGAVALAVTSVPAFALLAGLAAGALPAVVRGRRVRQRREARRAAWPQAIDVLVSDVRAGLSLPEALSGLAERGPAVLRPSCSVLAADLRSGVPVSAAIQSLVPAEGDVVAERIVTVVRLVDEVGGTSLSAVLRALAASLRAEASVRAEIAARQSWTVLSGRVAVAAPWLTLALLCLRPATAAAYRSWAGVVVIAVVAVTSLMAWLLMRRIARLPGEVVL